MHMTDPVLQRHLPVADERNGIIALLSALAGAEPDRPLTLTFGTDEPITVGPATLQAIRGLLSVLARQSVASVYVVDEAEFYEAPQVRELLGVTNRQLFELVHSGALPSLREKWRRQKRAHNPFAAAAVLEFISEKPLSVARNSALARKRKKKTALSTPRVSTVSGAEA